MKAQIVILTSNFQLVVPKVARKQLGLNKPGRQRFKVQKVTADEIVFRKVRTLNDFLGAYNHALPKNSTAELRSMRDEEWE